MFKKVLDDNEMSIVKRGRGKYIKFHSYKIYESGRIETIDGKPYEPVEVDGKAYLTLKFGLRTKGETKIEIARIVYSCFVSEIDIIENDPEIIYIDGNGMNFRLDNLKIKTKEFENVVEELENNEYDSSIQDVVNRENIGTTDKTEYQENEELEKQLVNENNLVNVDDLLSAVQEVLEENNENNTESEDLPMEEKNEVQIFKVSEINKLNTEAAALIHSNFVEELKNKEFNMNESFDKTLKEKDEEIERLKYQIESMIAQNKKTEQECYIIKKETFSKIYITFNRLIEMVKELRK